MFYRLSIKDLTTPQTLIALLTLRCVVIFNDHFIAN